jgi:hypothetical protein
MNKVLFESILIDADASNLARAAAIGWTLKFENGAIVRINSGGEKTPPIWWRGRRYRITLEGGGLLQGYRAQLID